MGKGSRGDDHTRELGENILATMVLNWVKHMAGILLEFCWKNIQDILSHPSRNAIKAAEMLVGDFVDLM